MHTQTCGGSQTFRARSPGQSSDKFLPLHETSPFGTVLGGGHRNGAWKGSDNDERTANHNRAASNMGNNNNK